MIYNKRVIKAVLFDFGGVLTEGGKAGGIQENIAKLCARPPADIRIDDLHYKFIRGQMGQAEYFAEINRRYPCANPVTSDSFNAGSNIYARCEPVYGLAAQLRASGIVTGILSNIYPTSAAKLRAEGFYDGFDPVIVSCSERMAKPEPAFFQLALDKLGLPGSEVLFIDDQVRFRDVAQSFGMHFIAAVSSRQIVAAVKTLLQKENNLTLETEKHK